MTVITRIGIGLTCVYINGVLLLRWQDLGDLQSIPLNELGDFLAGVFGPLMLFWVILGFIQQQRELRQNTRMLEVQAEELKKSVEQHKELVVAAREQVANEAATLQHLLEKERADSLPFFVVLGATSSEDGVDNNYGACQTEIRLSNEKMTCVDVEISFAPDTAINGDVLEPMRFALWESGQVRKIKLWRCSYAMIPKSIVIRVSCKTREGIAFVQLFQLDKGEEEPQDKNRPWLRPARPAWVVSNYRGEFE